MKLFLALILTFSLLIVACSQAPAADDGAAMEGDHMEDSGDHDDSMAHDEDGEHVDAMEETEETADTQALGDELEEATTQEEEGSTEEIDEDVADIEAALDDW